MEILVSSPTRGFSEKVWPNTKLISLCFLVRVLDLLCAVGGLKQSIVGLASQGSGFLGSGGPWVPGPVPLPKPWPGHAHEP